MVYFCHVNRSFCSGVVSWLLPFYHYFGDDSLFFFQKLGNWCVFNPNTGIVYDYVVERCKQMLSTLIVISATLDCIQPFFLSDLPEKAKPVVAETKPIENTPLFQPSYQFFCHNILTP